MFVSTIRANFALCMGYITFGNDVTGKLFIYKAAQNAQYGCCLHVIAFNSESFQISYSS